MCEDRGDGVPVVFYVTCMPSPRRDARTRHGFAGCERLSERGAQTAAGFAQLHALSPRQRARGQIEQPRRWYVQRGQRCGCGFDVIASALLPASSAFSPTTSKASITRRSTHRGHVQTRTVAASQKRARAEHKHSPLSALLLAPRHPSARQRAAAAHPTFLIHWAARARAAHEKQHDRLRGHRRR